jgi:drug/metabolite transporter (DMT)-like permease
LPLWFAIALACAFFTACCDAVSKAVMRTSNEWETGTAILGMSSILLFPLFVNLELQPFSLELTILMIVLLPLEVLGYYFFLSAVGMAPLSLTLPLLAFTLVFTIVTSGVLLGEGISGLGAMGIGLVTMGAYILNADLIREGFLAPIKSILIHPGSRRMLVTAVVWSVTSTLGKKGVLIYGAIPFGYLIVLFDLLVFGIIALIKADDRRSFFSGGKQTLYLVLLGGVLMSGAEVTHVLSISMAPVAYMISVKRLSLVFGVAFGWFFFGEKNVVMRLAGASIMVAGVFLLTV